MRCILNSAKFNEVVDIISKVKSALVLSHVSPDPDAVGSAAGLVHAMREQGKDVELYFFDSLPRSMQSVVGNLKILNEIPPRKYESLIILDTATKDRAGKHIDDLMHRAELSLNIDHHVSNNLWADVNFIDDKAAASSQIVHDILIALNWSFSKIVSNLLYAGIMDDTGSFRYSNTSSKVLLAAAKLVECGANPLLIANMLYFSVPKRVLSLRSDCLNTVEFHFAGKFAFLHVTHKMLAENSCGSDDTDGIIDFARSIEGVDICVFIKESDAKWKLSLRSKSNEVDLNKIANVFGGGGHKAASGCKVSGTLEEVKARVLEEFLKIGFA